MVVTVLLEDLLMSDTEREMGNTDHRHRYNFLGQIMLHVSESVCGALGEDLMASGQAGHPSFYPKSPSKDPLCFSSLNIRQLISFKIE